MIITSINAACMPLLAMFSSLLASMVMGEFIVAHVETIVDNAGSIEVGEGGEGGEGGESEGGEGEGGVGNDRRSGATVNPKKSTIKKIQKIIIREKEIKEEETNQVYLSMSLLLGVTFAGLFYWRHCVWTVRQLYSTPTIMIPSTSSVGKDATFNDFRETYEWIRTSA